MRYLCRKQASKLNICYPMSAPMDVSMVGEPPVSQTRFSARKC